MKKIFRKISVVVISIFAVGCGYIYSGTWEDSPKNWHRAFQSQKPQDVQVIHSKYWRSPHFTYESEYFFHIRSNDVLQDQLFSKNKLVKRPDDVSDTFFGDKPAWFIPKPTEKYDVWIYKDEPRGNFRLFIDKETGDLFLTDFQV